MAFGLSGATRSLQQGLARGFSIAACLASVKNASIERTLRATRARGRDACPDGQTVASEQPRDGVHGTQVAPAVLRAAGR
jgi:hypothetical protein